ncbi:MAG: hypothetical protein AB7O32_06530 [Vicinamibacterales bacterium]
MTHTEAVANLASERYLLDEMTEAERDAFEAHYFDCVTCAEDVRVGALMQEGAKAGFTPALPTARVATFTPAARRTAAPPPEVVRQAWYRSAALPWAVAATLAVVVGYQSQSSVPGPEADGGVRAVPTLVLRPASRGTAPTVSLSAPHAALALDVDASGASDLAYDLKEQEGALITSGRGSAPPAGAPFLVVIPTFTLKPQQRYILSVRDASDSQRVLGDYHFTTAP